MIELAEPRAFVPVHGARQHLEAHRSMARALGVGSDLVVENGQSVHLLEGGTLEEGAPFAARGVRVFAGRTLSDEVVRERRRIAEHGHILVLIRKDERGGVRGDPVVVVTGLAEGRAAQALEAEASRGVKRELAAGGPYMDDAALLAAAKYAARRVVVATLGIKPEMSARLLP
jgi:ribonuclease J